MSLSQVITVRTTAGAVKGTITYTYDAAGNKLQKIVAEGAKNDTTLYLGGTEYQNSVLQFIGHEEGRIRYAKKYFLTGDSAMQYFYDYFIKDHLGNVRMVLTEQKDTAKYIATMEAAYRAKENLLFANIPQTSYPKASVPGGYPTDNTTIPNDSVIVVNGSGNKKGPSLVLKVMSGDVVDVAVKSFYRSNGSPGGNSSLINDILSSLADGIVGIAGETKGTLSQLNNISTSPLLGALNSFVTDNNPNILPSKPKAYLNWILLDEQFNYVEASSGAIDVGDADELNTHAQGGIPITKNGFLYVYVSNETQNWNVFFDNLVVQHYTGPLQEETHYYPFGLTMSGISSKALAFGNPTNKIKFNGKELQSAEFSDGSGLEQYDFGFRNYDQQIGVWHNSDPLAEISRRWSPYTYTYNNPIRYIDPDGMANADARDRKYDKEVGERGKSKDDYINLLHLKPKEDDDGFFDRGMGPHYIAGDAAGGGDDDKKKKSGGDDDKLKGGKQKDRDRDIKQYPPEFQKWYHREYKPDVNPDRNATPEELKEVYKTWEDLGKPVVKAVATAGFWTLVGIAAWETVKWGAAVILAPETGGGL